MKKTTMAALCCALSLHLTLNSCTEPAADNPESTTAPMVRSLALTDTTYLVDTASKYFAFDNFDDTAYNHFTYWEGGYVVHPNGAPVMSQYLQYMNVMHTRAMLAHREAKRLVDSARAVNPSGSWYISGLAVNPTTWTTRQVKITNR
jgi:hypothetical protein